MWGAHGLQVGWVHEQRAGLASWVEEAEEKQRAWRGETPPPPPDGSTAQKWSLVEVVPGRQVGDAVVSVATLHVRGQSGAGAL